MSAQLLIQMCLLLWLSKALAVAASVAKSGCEEKCGEVEIPYPFGIGSRDCYLDDWFQVTCHNSSRPHKPILEKLNLEVLKIEFDGTLQVNTPVIYQNCPGKVSSTTRGVSWDGGPFSFSDIYNRFTGVGCELLASIWRDNTIIGGCVSVCNTTATKGGCYGNNCCQTEIPPDLRHFNASFGTFVGGEPGDCRYAFVVDQRWFSQITDPHDVETMESVPAVLNWGIDDPQHVNGSTTPCGALCGARAYCVSGNSTGSWCDCAPGYEGNPYLQFGCQDVNECLQLTNAATCLNGKACPARNRTGCPNGMVCRNTPGSYLCLEKKRPSILAFSVTGTVLGILLLLAASWWLYKVIKRRQKIKHKENCFKRNGGLLLQQLSSNEGNNVDKSKLFTSKEMEKATDRYNQNRILGQGGQGTVYKGMLADGKIVAVKRSKMVVETKLDQFINEVVILSQINHRNVVKLLGCCLETELPMLVYEFIPNGTLSEHIHDQQNEEFPITWEVRLRIATEVAGALSYLHSAASIPIFHRDIKSTNILLDDKYRAKVADFGTSKSLAAIDQTHLTTQVQGTFGYLDPEYFQSNQFTEKSDVYSFGVVLVELLTGKKPISSEGKSLATYFLLSMRENQLFDILDARVVKGGGKEEIMAIASLAKRCLNLNGKKRPTMMEVAMELERVKRMQGDYDKQNYDEVDFTTIDLNGPWDATSTSTGSYLNTNASSSSDVQPLLLQKPS